MPHSNGRIYTETRNGVRYGVTTEDVAAVLGQASLDVGTLCRASNINLWAKYRPLPLSRQDRGTPAALTDAARRQRDWGVNFASRFQINSQFDTPPENMVEFAGNGTLQENDMCVVPLEWNEGVPHWYNLLDFVRVDDNGNIVDGVGYNHLAVAAPDVVTLAGTSYVMAGAIFIASGRDVVIEDGKSYDVSLPNDLDFLYAMYNGGVRNEHPEAMSIMDLLMYVDGNNQNHALWQSNTAYARRCIQLITTSETLYNGVTDTSKKDESVIIDESDSVKSVDFSTSSDIVLSKVDKYGFENSCNLKDISGRIWVAEYYKVPNLVSHVPIPGLVYTINIQRVDAGAATVDIDGLLYFDRFDEWLFLILRSNVANLYSYLESQYTMLKLSVGNVEVNLLNSSAMTYSQGEQITQGGYRGWYEYYIDTHDAFTDSSQTTGIVSSIKSGQYVTATKTISVRIY